MVIDVCVSGMSNRAPEGGNVHVNFIDSKVLFTNSCVGGETLH